MEVDYLMFDNIFETIIKGSKTVFLDMPEEEFKFSYDSLTLDAAQEIAEDYFLTRARDGVPHAKDISIDKGTHRVKITLEVDHLQECGGEYYSIPDTLNTARNNE